ncbi:MAG TPA: FAD-dependent oxidoreductase [Candidatus Saccharimonadales bacterium]|nr:FAD-dependent oxidoreductase [Candidatus Saccharimonadales bacterium]
MDIVFDRVMRHTPVAATFWFRAERPVRFEAGQYVELTLRHDMPDSRGEKRWFTLSSTPGDELIGVTTCYAGDERSSSFKRALFALVPGAVLHMTEPMGDFVLPKDPAVPLLFVASGIGITPFRSMAGWLVRRGERRPIRLVYGVHTEQDAIAPAVFAQAGMRPTVIASRPSPAWQGEHGRLSAGRIMRLGHPSADTLIYLSGPEQQIESLARDLQALGIAPRQLVTDFFSGYST